jgi:OOP family OmpA-OmpF porin
MVRLASILIALTAVASAERAVPVKTPPAATVVEVAKQPAHLDLVTFAQGALPGSLTIDGAPQDLMTSNAVLAIDGSPKPFVLARTGTSGTVIVLRVLLPAPTTFDAFSVPEVREVPSRGTTFAREVQVFGSAKEPGVEPILLAQATLAKHAKRGMTSQLAMESKIAVRWLDIRLTGGLDIPDGKAAIQFSELVGSGTQESPPLVTSFTGVWKGPGVLVELAQTGTVVNGCYDSDGGELTGTVTGNVMRAIGVDPGDKVKSVFLFVASPGGELTGLRSTNGAPFRVHAAPVAPKGTKTKCTPRPAKVGCGSILHSINFDFDSAKIRSDSETALKELYAGLAGVKGQVIIVGHTSSEGAVKHNQQLSEKRAQSVVDDLIKRGLPRTSIRAAGKGSTVPIASNDDETGRSLNRRVEIECK